MNIPLKTLIDAVAAMEMAQKTSTDTADYMRLVKAWAALKVFVDEVIDAQKVEVTE